MIHFDDCANTEAFFNSQPVQRFKNINRVARRKLLQLVAVIELNTLRISPANHLELLKGNRKGQHSIRINDQ